MHGFAVGIVAVVVAVGMAGGADAQEAPGALSVEGYIGLFRDAYDIGTDGKTGTLAGVEVGWDVGRRLRLVANLGGASTSDVALRPGAPENNYWVYGNRWAITTIGAEYAVLRGTTGVEVGLQAGAGWRKLVTEDQVGEPREPGLHLGGGYSFYDVVVPSIALRQRIHARVDLTLGASDYVFDVLEAGFEHSPAVALGVTIR